MKCPFCNALDSKVIDSRLIEDSNRIRRRRECVACEARFNTYETLELTYPRVIKSDDTREEFDKDKLKRGLVRALEKRPIEIETIDKIVSRISQRMLTSTELEISSQQIGKWVMEELKAIDKIAFVRFASVYKDFQEVDEFLAEITSLIEHKKKKKTL